MSDDQGFDPEDYEGLPEKKVEIPRRAVRALEAKAKRADELEQKLAQYERERSFVKAGIPDTPMARYFIKGYDGPDDVDAIKAAATELGLLNPTDENQVNRSLDGHDAARAAASGAATPDPRVDLDSKMRAAKTKEELIQILEEAGVKPQDLKDFPQLRS